MDVVSDVISAVRIGQPSSDRVRVSGPWSTRLPSYDGVGFHMVLEGSCRLLPDGGGAPVVLTAGDTVLLPRGTGHVLADSLTDVLGGGSIAERAVPFEHWLGTYGLPVADGADGDEPAGPAVEMLCGKYRLDRGHTHPLLDEIPDIVHLPRRAGRYPELQAAIDLLGREAGAARCGGDVAVSSLLDLLLVYMVRAWLAEPAADDHRAARWPAALSDPVVAEALRALHEAPEAAWSNAELASRAGVSRATLARRFTSLVGRAPMAYLTWWRMTRAATLLRDTSAPLDAVARQVGYSSPYALSHAFTRTFGTTPGRYRGERRLDALRSPASAGSPASTSCTCRCP
ncbi:cupin domain-containing protein [Streptomyces sp. NPDC029674]|uniref:cupin domain-containing protein n=1 Tax=Streptomyces sp. NPDC029674 TaxID=3365297 RepID=UPI00384A63EE